MGTRKELPKRMKLLTTTMVMDESSSFRDHPCVFYGYIWSRYKFSSTYTDRSCSWSGQSRVLPVGCRQCQDAWFMLLRTTSMESSSVLACLVLQNKLWRKTPFVYAFISSLLAWDCQVTQASWACMISNDAGSTGWRKPANSTSQSDILATDPETSLLQE